MEVKYIIRDSQYANVHFIVRSNIMKNKGQLF